VKNTFKKYINCKTISNTSSIFLKKTIFLKSKLQKHTKTLKMVQNTLKIIQKIYLILEPNKPTFSWYRWVEVELLSGFVCFL
jgi:hypothetical protein